jgi:hypothetical protein
MENIETVKKMYELFATKDNEAIRAICFAFVAVAHSSRLCCVFFTETHSSTIVRQPADEYISNW